MKRFVACAVMCAALLCAAGAKAKTSKKPKGAVYTADRPEIFDWQGQALGREVPAWVERAVDGDKAGVKKELKLEKDSQVFLVSRDGQNLDFLKTWADQVDARAEVASSLKTTIAQTVQTTLTAQNVDKETVQRKADLYSATATNITLNGLQKMNSYWLKTRRLKTGVKKAKSDADYEYKTTYIVAFAIDSNVYSQQLKAAMDDVKDNDEATPLLRAALTEKCTETLGVEAAAAAVEPNPEIAAAKASPAEAAAVAGGAGMTGAERRAADLSAMKNNAPARSTAAAPAAAAIPPVAASTTVTAVTKSGDTTTVTTATVATFAGVRGELISDPTDFTYRLNKTNDAVVITGVKKHPSEDYSIVIPSEIEGYPVVEVENMDVGSYAPVCMVFADSVEVIDAWICKGWEELESVLLPSELITLGNSAFAGCKALKEVSASSAPLKPTKDKKKRDAARCIYSGAFSGCTALKRVSFPVALTEIDSNAFSGCTALEDVQFNEKLKEVGIDAFNGCTVLTSVLLPPSVEMIKQRAFKGCSKMKSVLLPKSCFISDSAFQDCKSLTKVGIPDGASLRYSGISVFSGCSSLPLSVQAEINKSGYKGSY